AWYDPTGATNYPKGCNNSALRDIDDTTVLYESDGYSNCGKTGSANQPAKVSHNGQLCGVMDLNGLMWEIDLGLTRDSGNADFYVLKESVAAKDLTSGQAGGTDAWGSAAHLATLYDVLAAAHITHESAWMRHGNGTNQVLSPATAGNGWLL